MKYGDQNETYRICIPQMHKERGIRASKHVSKFCVRVTIEAGTQDEC